MVTTSPAKELDSSPEQTPRARRNKVRLAPELLHKGKPGFINGEKGHDPALYGFSIALRSNHRCVSVG